jgi:hypothetical protein
MGSGLAWFFLIWHLTPAAFACETTYNPYRWPRLLSVFLCNTYVLVGTQ